ncbi:alpha/beta hydrolase [Zavarzinia aquatilis]|uniref:alpha/beta hydrolase n=1 Tax=Zavarzinia aquatilis TaxID=2211142 RepID=UPI001402A62F|nr:alpha/beta fold hydrolase [Zavarzinia aquatilis]
MCAALYVAVCGLMFIFQRSLQYFPDPAPMAPPGAGFSALALATPDGERLVAWWAPPADPARPVFLYLHGNGGNLAYRLPRLRGLASAGDGVMGLSWRGYGGSTGVPSEAGFMTDARAAYAALVKAAPGARVIIVGESIGTGIATMLAADVRPAGVILDSAFTSAVDIAAQTYPWLPVRRLMLDRFRADLAAPMVTSPVLQLHCRSDPVIPLALAERLTRHFPDGSTMKIVEQSCHVVPTGFFLSAAFDYVSALPASESRH